MSNQRGHLKFTCEQKAKKELAESCQAERTHTRTHTKAQKEGGHGGGEAGVKPWGWE